MKKILLLLLLFLPIVVSAQKYVKGYYRKDGTYVQGYYRSERNNTNCDNWSTKGNINPYTGNKGTKATDYSIEAYQQNCNRGKRYTRGLKEVNIISIATGIKRMFLKRKDRRNYIREIERK